MVFRGDFPGRVFTKNSVPGAPFKGINRVRGAPPGTKKSKWSLGRSRMSGSSRPSLGVQVLAVFSFIS